MSWAIGGPQRRADESPFGARASRKVHRWHTGIVTEVRREELSWGTNAMCKSACACCCAA